MDVVRYLPVAPLALALALGAVLAVLLVVPTLRRHGPRAAAVVASRVLLVGAVLAVLVLTQVSAHGVGGLNLVPGAGIREELGNANRGLAVVNIAGNVAMFVPAAFLAPLALGWRFGRTFTCGVLLSVAVEVFQTATGRSGDVDDVLLNGAGALIGAALGVAVTRAAWWARGDRPAPAGAREPAEAARDGAAVASG